MGGAAAPPPSPRGEAILSAIAITGAVIATQLPFAAYIARADTKPDDLTQSDGNTVG